MAGSLTKARDVIGPLRYAFYNHDSSFGQNAFGQGFLLVVCSSPLRVSLCRVNSIAQPNVSQFLALGS